MNLHLDKQCKPAREYEARLMPVFGSGVYRRVRPAVNLMALHKHIEYGVRGMRERGPYLCQMYRQGTLIATDIVG